MIEKPLIVSERIEARVGARFIASGVGTIIDTRPEPAKDTTTAAMNYGAWRVLRQLRSMLVTGEITTLDEVLGLVIALEVTYEVLAR